MQSTQTETVAYLGGIDVSHANPETDWQRVAAAGNAFAFIKSSEGYTYTNPFFARDWKASQEAGLLRGAYHYFRPEDEGVAQAEHMLRVIEANGAAGMILPQLDWEVADHIPAEEQKAQAMAFSQTILSNLGRKPGIYIAHYFAETLGDISWFSDQVLWVANYETTHPKLPSAWNDWTFWQYSESGSVPGVLRPCDCDYFKGSLDDLKKLIL